MTKKLFMFAALFMGISGTVAITSCGSDDDDNNGSQGKEIDIDNANDLDYSAEYAEQWANYMSVASNLLKNDASNLLKYWSDDNNGEYSQSYAKIFLAKGSNYPSAISCVETIIDGCAEIASEVGSSKIGEPYNLYSTDRQAALYAVESWYSWHSRDDYTNNIYSIRNSYFGSRNGKVNENSLSAVLAAVNPELDNEAKKLINDAAQAIQNIPQPFRNNINSQESLNAMNACAALEDFLTNTLKPYFTDNINDDATLDPVVKQYVNAVVLPTYSDLAAKNIALDAAVKAFKANPSNTTFEACAEAWLSAREPWEQSEAFLFGPVADKGLDPNMDSWPLDQKGIVTILKSQDFNNLNWSGEFDEDNDKIAKAQSLRGFHTLEYLIFKNGKPRTVK